MAIKLYDTAPSSNSDRVKIALKGVNGCARKPPARKARVSHL